MIYTAVVNGTSIFFDALGSIHSLKTISEVDARNRGWLAPLPRTEEQELHDALSGMTVDQLKNHIFLAGPRSLDAKVGKQVLAEKLARIEKENEEAEAEKIAAGSLTGETIPSRIPR